MRGGDAGAPGGVDPQAGIAALTQPVPDRILLVAQAYRHGLSTAQIQAACKFDPWFLEQVRQLVQVEERIRETGLPDDAQDLAGLKRLGFSDARLAELTGLTTAEVATCRRGLGIRPVSKRTHTCAGGAARSEEGWGGKAGVRQCEI